MGNIRYDPDSGNLYWKKDSVYNKRDFNTPIGSKENTGYLRLNLGINGVKYRLVNHKVCWFLHYGSWPDKEIDHTNRIKDDNSIKNLRLADKCENRWNTLVSKNSKLSLKGIHKRSDSGKFRVKFTVRGKQVNVGNFPTLEEAIQARNKAYENHHGKYSGVL